MSANHITTDQAREYLIDAYLSQQSYEDLNVDQIIGNYQVGYWKVEAKSEFNFNGYTGYAFRSEAARQEGATEIKIASRGTNSLLDLLIPDIAIGLDILPSFQLNSALEFTESVAADAQIKESQITQIGHSLGGAIAQLASMLTGSNAVGINAPGSGHLRNDVERSWDLEPGSLTNQDFTDRFTNINSTGDRISDVGNSIGTTYEIEVANSLTTTLVGVVATAANPVVGVAIWRGGYLLEEHGSGDIVDALGQVAEGELLAEGLEVRLTYEDGSEVTHVITSGDLSSLNDNKLLSEGESLDITVVEGEDGSVTSFVKEEEITISDGTTTTSSALVSMFSKGQEAVQSFLDNHYVSNPGKGSNTISSSASNSNMLDEKAYNDIICFFFATNLRIIVV